MYVHVLYKSIVLVLKYIQKILAKTFVNFILLINKQESKAEAEAKKANPKLLCIRL